MHLGKIFWKVNQWFLALFLCMKIKYLSRKKINFKIVYVDDLPSQLECKNQN